ncbi:uncharacterized protein FFB20_00495 [Fusarium fujikuroi]|uniref:Uncharacterized protein n=1 Tax=Fusarium fujikuroi TaxID=5127 RepID=A0A2H3RYW3_FUSFU|nr:uncharacterized protein Y057_9610 [Fusarium fujikuroi]KLP15878.1 uncharacterized protein LW94_13122 [Fusarium fujikuroi]QGI60905.1 hypothetical protein CEK27_004876 [Fusarium fujikuroi]QGI78092.1 hypothetical protein CEK25_004821 [Fusarium fujikuroi]QGI91806.1 hypothetical protein CEK26_004875 [Fusarium fujikuroi]
MVSLSQAQQTNASAASKLPAGLVAVFAGATAGIGETALKAFAKYTTQPKIYYIGRSQEAGDRLQIELKELNPEGEYVFIKKDMSLLKNVDEVCRDIKSKETVLNVLFLNTEEGLPLVTGLTIYSRNRLTVNLLPLLKKSPSLRRVISVMAGTHEGKLFSDDIAARNIPFTSIHNSRGHMCSALTLSLEALARQAPEVSFIHNFPGSVDTNLIRSGDGFMMQVMKYWFKVSMTVRRQWLPKEECGERHAWLCLTGRYPDKEGSENGIKEGEVAVGTDGKRGSGVYSVDWDGESASGEVVKLLDGFKEEGLVEKVWKDQEKEFIRITGVTFI